MVTGLVLDASTAILLAKIGLLRRVLERVGAGIGTIAASEALRKQSDDAVAIAILIDEGKLRQFESPDGIDALVRDFRLHPGEAEAVALARMNGAVCGTDDARAIRCCKALGIPFATAIGLLVEMTEASELDSAQAAELLVRMQRFGRYHPRIHEEAARRIRIAGGDGEAK
jgi:predicted nucleic acid-binding protein